MFHRVKSEMQQDQNEQEMDMVPAEEQAAEIEEAAVEADEDEVSEQEAPVAEVEEVEQAPVNAYQAPVGHAGYTAPSYAAVGQSAYRAPAPVAAMSSHEDSEVGENDRRLTIGRGITMSGEIECCDYLLVEGTVEAALKGANALDIAESGVFYGTVEIEDATIAGRFEGDIQVNGRLTVASTGVVTGTIAYKELQIEAGAVIDGRLTPVSAKAPAAAMPAAAPKAKSAKPAVAPMKMVKKAPTAPANNDGELFAESVTAAE